MPRAVVTQWPGTRQGSYFARWPESTGAENVAASGRTYGIHFWARRNCVDDPLEPYPSRRGARAVYALQTAYDRQPILTVSAAIAYGERILRMDRVRTLADPAPSAR